MPSNLTTQEFNARVAKLPKWAQEELRVLTRERDDALVALEDMRAGQYGDVDTDTVADPYSDAPLKLKRGETVGFRLGYGSNDDVRVNVDRYGSLQVSGQRSLRVLPRAANVVLVELLAD